jgi:hypothetical protein
MATEKKKTKYPVGGIGLLSGEEEKLLKELESFDISLKYLQRFLIRKFLRGEIDLGIPRVK